MLHEIIRLRLRLECGIQKRLRFIVAARWIRARLHNFKDELLFHAEILSANGIRFHDGSHSRLKAQMQAMRSRHVFQHNSIRKMLIWKYDFSRFTQNQTPLGIQRQPIGQHSVNENGVLVMVDSIITRNETIVLFEVLLYTHCK